MKYLLGFAVLVLGSGVASAQFNFGTPYGAANNGIPSNPTVSPVAGFPSVFPNAASFMPNVYNRQTQPLSPYLNMLRGGNPAVNYFYGVRPGLPNAGNPLGTMQSQTMMNGQIRSGFLPLTPPNESVKIPEAGQPVQLPPSGTGGAVFGNRFGNMHGGVPGAGGGRNGFTGSNPPASANRGGTPAKK